MKRRPLRLVARLVGLAAAVITVFAIVGTGSASAAALFPQCPPIGQNTGCSILVSVNADGTTSVLADPTPPNNGPYDGEDDTLVGFQNNASYPIASINLSSATRPIFGFDGDGICAEGLTGNGRDPSCPPGSSATESFVPASAGGTGYEGPNNTFTNISENTQSGTVKFTHSIAAGGSTYFALEETLLASDVNVGGFTPEAPPTPPTVVITSGPKHETTATKATFTFTGVPGGTYECSIDGGAWKACSSGQTYGPFAPGDHQFQVRETLVGVTGSPATYKWTVDIPKPCILKVARARVFVFTKKSRVRLVIHYTTYQPAMVTVSYKLKGSKGGLNLGSASKRFATKGLFRLPETLDRTDMRKVRGATEFKVRFKIRNTPKSCTRYYSKRLTLKKKIQNQTVWFQSDSVFAP